MAFRTPRARTGLRRRPRWLVPTVVSVIAVLVVLGIAAAVWTDVLWYQATGYLSAYGTRVRARVALFVLTGVLMALVVAANIMLAYRLRPPYRALTPEQQGLERYRTLLEPRRGLVLAGLATLIGLIAGLSMEGQWRTWLLFLNQKPFGVKDPLFGMDIAYFVFTYPFLRMVLGYGFAVILVAVIAAAFTHYLYGGIRLQSEGERISPATGAHLSVLIGVFVLLRAWGYWLDRHGLVYSNRNGYTGAWYTDVNAVLPAKTILTIIAILCAVLFFAAVVRRGLMLPAAGFGLLVLSAILIGGVYPAIVQQFQVDPTELSKERQYIDRNIKATRAAFSVNDVKISGYEGTTDPSDVPSSVRQGDVAGSRLLDPGVVPETFQQLQQIRGYYKFSETLDVGRYTIDGAKKASIVAVRGLDGPPQGRGNWVNAHLTYTHGYGFVAADASTVTDGGEPQFVAQDIPTQGQLGDFEPRIYFGQIAPEYSIVGGTQDSIQELDYPSDAGSGQRSSTYSGQGGVSIGSPLKKLAYALQFQDPNILLSEGVSEGSRLMYIREPRERIERVAPFLELDGNPYPAIVNGRIKWIVDGYTTTNLYPYANRTGLEQATADTNTATSRAVAAQPPKQVNYIRNSVKATVDAYSGKVTLYQWNEKDPILRTWMEAFPGLVQPKSEISDALMQHLRYPEDLFKVQREILRRYHVTNPTAFYNGSDIWQIPNDPTVKGRGQAPPQPPYYLMLQKPGSSEPAYSLTTTYVPENRPNLAAFMSVDSTPGEGYGQLQILRLPRTTSIAGPGQMQNDFTSDASVSQQLALLGQGDRDIVYGNLLTLPVGNGLLYIEPVYVKASGGQSYPLLQQVLVSFGNQIGYAPTLEEALSEVFPAGSGQTSGDDQQGSDQQGGQSDDPSVSGDEASAALQQALQDARDAYEAAQKALRNGDYAEYGRQQENLKNALDEAAEIQESFASGGGGGSGGSRSGGAGSGGGG